MALITCRECGHKMSDRAESCPHCGCPQHIPDETTQLPDNQQPEETYAAPAKKQGGLKWLWAVIPSFLVIAGAVYYFMFVYTPPTAAPKFLYPDYAFHNLHGKVKDVRLYEETDSGTLERAFIQFDSDGRITPDDGSLIRNDKGEIIKVKVGDEMHEIIWENGRVTGERSNTIFWEYKYNRDGSIRYIGYHALKDIPGTSIKKGDVEMYTYSDYKFDEHGNWISYTRQIEYIPKEGEGSKSAPVHLSRRITYYP